VTGTKPAISRPVVLTRALREFLATEVAGGVVLLAATAIALAWANSPWRGGYRRLWETELAVRLGQWSIALDLRHWVNEGLMAIFFVVVGLEIKRELFEGELRDRRQAALPVIAAVGGMVVPAGLYLAVTAGGSGARGWGIPMATDIAFALGVAALVGRGLPPSLRLFLLTLAIVDDIGAILVIALFYSGGIGWGPLTAALVLIAGAYAVRQAGVLFPPLFVAFGALVWLALHQSGLHATLAGVAMGLLAPTRPRLSREIVLSRGDELLDVFSPEAARTTSRLARLSVSPMEWLEHLLHPWTSLLVLPVFALANAGVSLSGNALDDAARSPVTWGVVLGLVVGKPVGIAAFSWLACRLGLASLPNGVGWPQLVGVGALGGIGFTISLFVSDLAFDSPGLVDEAKVGILVSSLLAALAGSGLLLALSSRSRGPRPRRSPSRSSRR
jgi:NhaA family Na+:H+ antiporter